MKNTAVTTKNGIHRSLKGLKWVAKEDVDGIFPRCYDLSFPSETGEFLDDARFLAAEAMLKRVLVRVVRGGGGRGGWRLI